MDQQLVIAGSLGYFCAAGECGAGACWCLKERLNAKAEWAAVGLAVAAVGNEFVAPAARPGCRCSGGTFRALRAGAQAGAGGCGCQGCGLETLSMLPLVGAVMLWQSSQGHAVFTGHDGVTTFCWPCPG